MEVERFCLRSSTETMDKRKKINIILTNEGKIDNFKSLNDAGFSVFHFPMISTSQNESKKSFLNKSFDYFIFTSKNGVNYFFTYFNKKFRKNKGEAICIGTKTEKELKKYNIKSAYVAKKNYSKILSQDLKESGILKSKNVLLVQGNKSQNYLYESLKMYCDLTKFVAYNTELIRTVDTKLKSLIDSQVTYSVFTSPSCFEAFINLYDAKKTNIISIGQSTSLYIKNLGFSPMITSSMQTYEGIADSIIAFFNKKSIS